MDPTWMDEMVSMMSGGVSGDAVIRRVNVKQETESPQIYSPSEQSVPINSVIYLESEQECKEELKYDTAPPSPERQFCSSTTQPMGATQTEETSCKEEETPRRLCLVCGDVASGFHYGVASCEACKAFFKRTIQGNIEYTCPASNECEINKRRRKACQACRFRKCLRTGMLREGVRLDRVRGGRQKYRRADTLPLNTHTRPSLHDIKLVEIVCSFEPDLLSSPPTAASTLHALADLYDRELVGVIGWAKQIPGFTELQLNDQMRLLQSTWAELLSLMLAYRSMNSQSTGSNGIRLKFATDLTLDEHEAKEIGAHELYQQVVQIVGRLERLQAQKEEYYLLKALALANSEARLDDSAALHKFRDSILSALNDAVAVLRPYNAPSTLQQLLLVLPSLRAADYSVRRFWSAVKSAAAVPMNKLFVEMLESYFR